LVHVAAPEKTPLIVAPVARRAMSKVSAEAAAPVTRADTAR
jgi:hypothetical protein